MQFSTKNEKRKHWKTWREGNWESHTGMGAGKLWADSCASELQGRRTKDSGESLKNKSRTDRSPGKFPYGVEKLAITIEKMK